MPRHYFLVQSFFCRRDSLISFYCRTDFLRPFGSKRPEVERTDFTDFDSLGESG